MILSCRCTDFVALRVLVYTSSVNNGSGRDDFQYGYVFMYIFFLASSAGIHARVSTWTCVYSAKSHEHMEYVSYDEFRLINDSYIIYIYI